MNKDKHLERRKMIISKYSNRPPFDLKKPRNYHDIVEKIKSYPEETCENCCKKRIALSNSENLPKSSRKFMSHSENSLLDTKLKSKKAISKVIQQFQNVTPTRVLEEGHMSQNTSVQTIYRKGTTCNLGRNIPKHHLMKSLLQNLESGPERSKFFKMKTTNSTQTRKSSCKEKMNDKTNICTCKKCPKVDKKTSTTGLPWPPRRNEIIHYHPSTDSKKVSSYSCARSSKASFKSKFSGDEIPTRDVPNQSAYVVNAKRDEIDRKTREKTFVQAQVDKLNKGWRPTKIPGNCQLQTNQKSKNSRTLTVDLRQQQESGYIEMMNKIRNNCRQFDASSTSNFRGYGSTTSWSNGSETGLLPENIQFPRETRTAVDQRLREESQRRRTRIPLSKFTTKNYNFYKPALPSASVVANRMENSDGDDGCHYPQAVNRKLKKAAGSKVKIPCKKDLLCHKVDQHVAGCAYAKCRNNKV